MSAYTPVSVQPETPESVETSPEDDHSMLPRDEIFHLLQNERRRLVLRYLTEHGDDIEMRDVAEQVAAWENDTTVAGLTSDARQRVYIALYQSHLPKLDENGVIEYDRNRGTIEPCTPLSQLEPYLPETAKQTEVDDEEDEDDENTIPWEWNDYYLGLAVLSMLSVLAVALYAPSAGVWLSTIIAGTLGVSTLIQRF